MSVDVLVFCLLDALLRGKRDTTTSWITFARFASVAPMPSVTFGQSRSD
jgi:hypothetical protein